MESALLRQKGAQSDPESEFCWLASHGASKRVDNEGVFNQTGYKIGILIFARGAGCCSLTAQWAGVVTR